MSKVGVGVACFVWKDDRFLVTKRLGSHGAGTWSLPGGHQELGETWAETAAREVREETGLEITNGRFLAVTNDIFTSKHYITIWMQADWLSGTPRITEPDRCTDQTWCTFKTLPTPLFEPCWQNLRLTKPELFI